MSDFPTVLSGAVDFSTPIWAKFINNLETKVGVDQSAVATSLDYLIKSAGGWIPIPATCTYDSDDAPTFTFTIPGDVTGLLSPGMRIRLTQTTVKYFIITAVSYSSPNTTVTVYGGTDYALVSAAITTPYFSMAKAPQGFPLSPLKWTVSVVDANYYDQSNPAPNTWYNLGGISVSIPIGTWYVEYLVMVGVALEGGEAQFGRMTLSTSNDGETDPDISFLVQTFGPEVVMGGRGHKNIEVVSKTTYYINENIINEADSMWVEGDPPTIIKAICAYL